MELEFKEKINPLYYDVIKSISAKHFEELIDYQPESFKHLINDQKTKDYLFNFFLAGYACGFHEFESMEQWEKERNNIIK